MLAYAASRRRELADRRPHPNMMLVIIGAHVALLAAVMSAKMDLANPFKPEPPLIVDTIKAPPPPPPIGTTSKSHATQTFTPVIDRPPQNVKLTQLVDLPPLGGRTTGDLGSIDGGGAIVIPKIEDPIRTSPQLLTPQSEMKPSYPASKLLNEEEGAVTVRLTIDQQGRVIAVDPVGRADAAFLDAARRHLLAHWRFKPASEDGRAITSITVVTLHFQLDS
jgi:periplasmic protein TonB